MDSSAVRGRVLDRFGPLFKNRNQQAGIACFPTRMDSLMTLSSPLPRSRARHRMALLASALALACLVAPAMAVGAAPGGMEMHRKNAGTLGPDGWTTATSTNGAYSVRLPCRFNDFTFRSATAEVTQSDVIGCVHDEMKFLTLRARYRDEAAAAKNFEGFGIDRPIPGASPVRSTYRDLPMIAVDVENAQLCALSRIVRTDNDNIMMSIEAPASKCEATKKAAAVFFDSLEQGADAPAAPVATELRECPLDTELSRERTLAAFKALPREIEQQMPADKCLPATTTTVLMKVDGLCRIGNARMVSAGLVTLNETGAPIAMLFTGLYSQEAQSALQASLEGRYKKEPRSAYTGRESVTEDITTVVSQPGGTLVVVTQPSEGTRGTHFSLVHQFAPKDTALVNRDLNTCR